MMCDGGKHYHVVAAVAQKLGLPATTECMKSLRLVGVPYVVAPYDADSQLAYIAKSGTIWVVWKVDRDYIFLVVPVDNIMENKAVPFQ
jgi:5'-3' exonuclease